MLGKSYIKKRSSFVLLLLVIPLIFIFEVFAQGPSRRAPGSHPIVKAIDINGDGSISASELKLASDSLLKLDQNNDGLLTAEELRYRHSGRRPFEGAKPEVNEKSSRRNPSEDRRRAGGPRPNDLGESPLDIGQAGIAWYPKLEDGLAEAKRLNKPIMFMAAASQCGGVPGVF